MSELDGVLGITIVFADRRHPRSRTVPAQRLAEAGERGVGITTLFSVFYPTTPSPSTTSRSTASGERRARR
jgi:hypothetical protein